MIAGNPFADVTRNPAHGPDAIVEPLGRVDFVEKTGLDASGEPLWFRIETSRAGLLTLEASSVYGGDVALRLLNAKGRELATSDAGTNVRIDWEADARHETYYVGLAGHATQADLVVANLVAISDEGTRVDGTARDDVFDYFASRNLVVINGVTYVLEDDARPVTFYAGAGNDTAILRGTAGDEVVRLWPGIGRLDTGARTVVVKQVESIVARSGGGSDLVKLYGQDGVRNAFAAMPDYAKLSGPDFANRAVGFAQAYGYAADASDVARLNDDPTGADTLVVQPGDARLYGADHLLRALGFVDVRAYASGADDRAKLYGAADTPAALVATPEYARLSGDGLSYLTVGFGFVEVHSGTPGQDRAYLTDSVFNDELREIRSTAGRQPASSSPSGHSVLLHNVDGLSPFSILAVDFGSVEARSIGGNDRLDVDPAAFDWLVIEGNWGEYTKPTRRGSS